MIYGYDDKTINEYGLKQMREITLCTNPKTLRLIALFLDDAASQLEDAISPHWHRHLPTAIREILQCDIVVMRPDIE